MNARRVAALHRELARVHADLADAIEADDGEEAPMQDRPSQTRQKPVRKPRQVVRPVGESTPAAAARADRILRDRGLR